MASKISAKKQRVALTDLLQNTIKTLRKEQKEKLIQKQIDLEDIFYERLECEKYKRLHTKTRI